MTNNQNRLDTREGVGQLQVEFTNSDVASVTYTDNFDRLVRPFAIAPGVTIPVGAYTFHTTRIGYIAGQQRRFGRGRLRDRPFYNGDRRPSPSTPRAYRSRRSLAGAELLDQLGRSRAGFVHRQGRPDPRHLHDHAAHVRQRHLQYNSASTSVGSNLRFRWEYQPGSELFVVYTDDYDTEPARRRGGASQPRDCRQVQPAVPAVATSME